MKKSLGILWCGGLFFSTLWFLNLNAKANLGTRTIKKQAVVAAVDTIQLIPVVTTGLSNPVYVTNAHDGTNRLFIVELGGVIKVLQPGSSTPTVFLNIDPAVASGGERGLLGLAFHPQYSTNRRFFVYYTREPDGAIVIAEYQASATNANVANTAETMILTIPHPGQSNHNGGTIQFGADGYLYIGPGDGGSSNDPSNNGQNIDALLGKILRIDIDNPSGGLPYSSPSSNPFFGATAGADEIYAYGMRNPYRFSFDRSTGQLYVADVGQGAREEVSLVTLGGNYGWRIMEGSICTPAFNGGVCTPPSNHVPPITEYSHSGGRCSITGGYVYRGSQAALPTGTYLFADYCTGEIFSRQNGLNTSPVLLDTTMNITGFGEDERGELYVVGGGTVHRIANPNGLHHFAISTVGTQTAGVAFNITITAQDAANNTVTGFTGTVTLSTTAGTISPSSSGALNGGVRTESVTVTQAGANRTISVSDGYGHTGTSNNFTVTDPCSYNISPAQRNFSDAGGTGTINVTANAGCAWTAVSNTSWVMVTSGEGGSGNGAVTYQVGSNTGVARHGMMTIAGQTFTVRQGANYSDVAPGNIFYESIGKLSAAGITSGCGTDPSGNPLYCPGEPVTREQMATFIVRALGEFTPPAPASQRFIDVPPSNIFYAFIDRLAALRVTAGCNVQSNQFCPSLLVNREQMAAFIMRARGEFNPPMPAQQRFTDVPPENIFYAFIDRLAALEITFGCNPQMTQFCPNSVVNREQMAAFLVRAFGL
jgi:glucose/arabinose dehydrogenase